MGKYKELAADIVAHVGGKENVTGLRHCFTRLRFNLADDKKADTAYLKNRDGVISVVNSGGEYMVVIGEHVHDVYLDVCEVLGVDAGDSGQVKNSDASAAQKKNPLMQEYMIEKNKDFAPRALSKAFCRLPFYAGCHQIAVIISCSTLLVMRFSILCRCCWA